VGGDHGGESRPVVDGDLMRDPRLTLTGLVGGPIHVNGEPEPEQHPTDVLCETRRHGAIVREALADVAVAVPQGGDEPLGRSKRA